MSEMYSTEQQFLRNVDIFGYGFFGLFRVVNVECIICKQARDNSEIYQETKHEKSARKSLCIFTHMFQYCACMK